MATDTYLQLTVSRVDGPIFQGEVISVTLPGIAGEMTILAHHTPLISPLKKGTITIVKVGGEKEVIEIESGTLEISQNNATILI